MEEVYNFIRKEIGLSVGDTIVVGVSGGPDSMALLYILNEFKNNFFAKFETEHKDDILAAKQKLANRKQELKDSLHQKSEE